LGLIGLEEDIAGVGGGFEVFVGDEDVQHLPRQGPGLGAALQTHQGAGHLKPDTGNLTGAALVVQQLCQPLLEGLKMGLDGRLLGGPVEDGIGRRIRQTLTVKIE